MRRAEFWLNRIEADDVGWDRIEARRHVTGGIGTLDASPDRVELPPETAEVPKGFRAPQEPWCAETWSVVQKRAQARVVDPVLAITVERASLRAYPTNDPAFRGPDDEEFDQFQMTRIHLMEPVRILAESPDRSWYWVESRICAGWIEANSVARASLADWTRALTAQDAAADELCVVTGNHVMTESQPYDPPVSRKPLEFGAYLPIWEGSESVGRQHAVGHLVVGYPVRAADGDFELRPALVKADHRVSVGLLPYRRASVVRSIFTQLGDRYDWGDRLGNHDCSSLVMDTYRTVGVQIPRNSGTQSRSLAARTEWSSEVPFDERLADLGQAKTGDLLCMPGHVMMYLGTAHGVPYAIHAFVGYAEAEKEAGRDSVRPVLVNAVEVSSLATLTRRGTPYLNAVTKVCRMS